MRLSRSAIAAVTFTLVGAGCFGGALWAVGLIERRSEQAVARTLLREGEDWAKVEADGLQLILTGTAASEAVRFRALTIAGRAVDSARLVDAMQVAAADPIEPPRFSVELLRNDDGISLIGLVPAAAGPRGLAETIASRAPGAEVVDMLQRTNHPAPPTWAAAVAFGLEALDRLPRSKISISADRVAVTAIGDSVAEKRRLEAELARLVPEGIALALDISAPRPVVTPFTLRFIIDEGGARFDACSADNARGRDRILAAGIAAGAPGQSSCILGLGVPSPNWADAATTAIAALADLGAGSVTLSDADVSLIAADSVARADFDRVAGDLEARLPDVFSLSARLQEKPASPEARSTEPVEFTATLSPEGQVQLRGRITDELVREAVDSYARARFGAEAVYTAARLDPDLPEGWPVRALAGLEALAELHNGAMTMRADLLELRGITGKPDASDTISRILSEKLGPGQAFRIDVRYDERLDPLAGLPTPEECVAEINRILDANKVTFAPGSANIEAAAGNTLNAIADMVRLCPDVQMEIGGHTDSQGRASMNLNLSQQRADSVLSALMDRRVLVGSLTAKGYGAEQPIADNATEEGREANRRIEFRLILPDEVVEIADTTAELGDPVTEETLAAALNAGATDPDGTGADAVAPDEDAPDAATPGDDGPGDDGQTPGAGERAAPGPDEQEAPGPGAEEAPASGEDEAPGPGDGNGDEDGANDTETTGADGGAAAAPADAAGTTGGEPPATGIADTGTDTGRATPAADGPGVEVREAGAGDPRPRPRPDTR